MPLASVSVASVSVAAESANAVPVAVAPPVPKRPERAIASESVQPRWRRCCWVAALALAAALLLTPAAGTAQDAAASSDTATTLSAEITALETAFTDAFNRGDVEALVAAFTADGEIVDDGGLLYRGHDELRQLFSGYFEHFPDTTLVLAIDSIRTIGDSLAIEEGSRLLSTTDQQFAQVRYIATLVKTDGRWLLASIREFYDEPLPQPRDHLADLEWMIGDWISESDDRVLHASYRWAAGEQSIIGSLRAVRDGQVVLDTEQRIGWDPRAEKIRSWMFDSDGGLGGGLWTATDDGWLLRSESVDPLGIVGNSTIRYRPLDANRYQIVGTDRIVGDQRLDDFEVTITRAPPTPAAAAARRGTRGAAAAPGDGETTTDSGSETAAPQPNPYTD